MAPNYLTHTIPLALSNGDTTPEIPHPRNTPKPDPTPARKINPADVLGSEARVDALRREHIARGLGPLPLSRAIELAALSDPWGEQTRADASMAKAVHAHRTREPDAKIANAALDARAAEILAKNPKLTRSEALEQACREVVS